MKRFLLFTGCYYYPAGGWDDFVGAFDTAEAALEAATAQKEDWWHVVDTTTMKEVAFLAADSSVAAAPL